MYKKEKKIFFKKKFVQHETIHNTYEIINLEYYRTNEFIAYLYILGI